MYEIKLEKFNGPLDLLLRLIEQEELDITQVSLSQVTDQYLVYLGEIEKVNPEEIADFLVVAAKLLFIKSRLLLPTLPLTADDSGPSLEEQLKIYREYLEAGRLIDKMWKEGRVAWVRLAPLTSAKTTEFFAPPGLTAHLLAQALTKVISYLEPIINLPEVTMRKAISIQEKILEFKNMVLEKLRISWKVLTSGSQDKTEVIVTFLALLELIKQRQVVAEQPELFEDIVILKS